MDQEGTTCLESGFPDCPILAELGMKFPLDLVVEFNDKVHSVLSQVSEDSKTITAPLTSRAVQRLDETK